MKYIKCHGTGNMFYLIDEFNNEMVQESEKGEFARRICQYDKESDGVLFLTRGKEGIPKMRIFNSDGTEPEMCGNGLRCVARYAAEKLSLKEFEMETLKARYSVKVVENGFEDMPYIAISIKGISSNLKDIPLESEKERFVNEKIQFMDPDVRYTALSVTNPHIVAINEKMDLSYMKKQGETIIKRKDFFPEGINLSFLKELNKGEVFVRTFERGVGFTKSCGTGMMASVTNYCINNPEMFEKDVDVFNDGGMVRISIKKQEEDTYEALFQGNATYVESGELSFQGEGVQKREVIYFPEEEGQYGRLLEFKDSKTKS